MREERGSTSGSRTAWVRIPPPPRTPNMAAQASADLTERGRDGFAVVTTGLQETWEAQESVSEDAELSLCERAWAPLTENLSTSKRGLRIKKDPTGRLVYITHDGGLETQPCGETGNRTRSGLWPGVFGSSVVPSRGSLIESHPQNPGAPPRSG